MNIIERAISAVRGEEPTAEQLERALLKKVVFSNNYDQQHKESAERMLRELSFKDKLNR